jgi:hypothetical protein
LYLKSSSFSLRLCDEIFGEVRVKISRLKPCAFPLNPVWVGFPGGNDGKQRNRRVGSAGAGTMGNGSAQVFAQAGYLIPLSDFRQDILDRAMITIEKHLTRMAQKRTRTIQAIS